MRTLPLKKGKSGEKNFIYVKNLKTLKVGSLFVSVNSKTKIIEPPNSGVAMESVYASPEEVKVPQKAAYCLAF